MNDLRKPTILLVDDHHMFRAGLKSLIEKMEDFVVVAEAADIGEAMIRVGESLPDIVITDLSIGRGNGLELIPKVQRYAPQTRLVVLSMHSSEALVSECLKRGASAYLVKEAAPEELGIALRAVWQGETYLSPSVSTKMINRFVRPGSSAPSDPVSMLSPRQVEIMTMLASGRRSKEIAHDLELSEKTVAAHRAQIMERLGINDLVGLVLFAVRHGLINVDKPYQGKPLHVRHGFYARDLQIG